MGVGGAGVMGFQIMGDDEVVERAAEVVSAEIDRTLMRLHADYLNVRHRIETEIFPLMARVADQLLEFAKLCEGLDEWEDDIDRGIHIVNADGIPTGQLDHSDLQLFGGRVINRETGAAFVVRLDSLQDFA